MRRALGLTPRCGQSSAEGLRGGRTPLCPCRLPAKSSSGSRLTGRWCAAGRARGPTCAYACRLPPAASLCPAPHLWGRPARWAGGFEQLNSLLLATRLRAGRAGVAGTRSTPARSAPSLRPCCQVRRLEGPSASWCPAARWAGPQHGDRRRAKWCHRVLSATAVWPALPRGGARGAAGTAHLGSRAQGPGYHQGANPAPRSPLVLKPLQDQGAPEPWRQENKNR